METVIPLTWSTNRMRYRVIIRDEATNKSLSFGVKGTDQDIEKIFYKVLNGFEGEIAKEENSDDGI